MKVKFKQLIISNFMSFGKKDTVVNLDTELSTLILGINKDVGREGQSRNGVGKSTIFQALVWVLFNEGIENIKQDQFINLVNKKKLLVTLIFEVDGVELVLQRGRKPAVLSLTKDDEPYTMHSVDTVDETIRTLIGMNFDTFTNTQLLSTNITPYMAMKPAPQRDLMERMVGLDVLSKRAAVVKAKLKNITVDIKLEEQKIENDSRNHEKAVAYVTKLEGDSNKFKQDCKDKIAELKEELKLLEAVDIEAERKLNAAYEENEQKIKERKQEIDTELDKLEDALSDIDTNIKKEKEIVNARAEKEISDLAVAQMEEENQFRSERSDAETRVEKTVKNNEESLNNELAEYERVEKDIEDIESRIEKGEELLLETVTEKETLEKGECPYCGQEHFDEDKVKQLNESIASLQMRLEESEDELKQQKTYLPKIESVAETLHENLTRSQETLLKEQKHTNDVLTTIKDKYNDLAEVIKEEQKKALEDVETEFDKEKASLRKQMEDLDGIDYVSEFEKLEMTEYSDDELAAIVKEIEMIHKNIQKVKDSENPFTSLIKDAKKEVKNTEVNKDKLYDLKEREEHCKILVKLLTESKSFVRKKLLDQYIPYINQRIAYYTERLDLPHIVTLNNDLTSDIVYMNNAVSYGNLSNGEKGRLNFSMSMALRDLLGVSGHSFNVLMIDELLDNGIDTSGFIDIFKVLKEKEGESLFIISHREDLITEVDMVTTIVKEGGFTHVLQGIDAQVQHDYDKL